MGGDVERVSLATILLVTLMVIVVSWAGIRLVGWLVGDLVTELGPATECGSEISDLQAELGNRVARCEAYRRAINEVVSRPQTTCPNPGGFPPAACGIYSRYLRAMGCPDAVSGGAGTCHKY
jgi:hypothetical protein